MTLTPYDVDCLRTVCSRSLGVPLDPVQKKQWERNGSVKYGSPLAMEGLSKIRDASRANCERIASCPITFALLVDLIRQGQLERKRLRRTATQRITLTEVLRPARGLQRSAHPCSACASASGTTPTAPAQPS